MKRIVLIAVLSGLQLTVLCQSTTLVISQVYGGGGNAGATYLNDYVVVFNKGNVAVDINGYSIQYASATGVNWTLATLSNVSYNLQPGQYFLLRLGSGGGAGSALPGFDATNTLNINASAGKLALLNNSTLIPVGTSCPTGSGIIDFVGYGTTANCREGAANAPAGSTNTDAIFRQLNGCQDTDQNGNDFLTGPASPLYSASPFNPCSGSCIIPTIGSSLFRHKSSGVNSLNLLFNRGNGTGAIVLCREAGPVNTTPVNGTAYTANSTFMLGSVLNTDNYVVHSTTLGGTVGFTVTGLTAGTKYYFSVFEYNDPGKCYMNTGLVDSFVVGANILKTGDMVLIGWDNNGASLGNDKLYLMNMVSINTGTKFSLVNSRYEAGAAANVRTNRWYGGGDDPYQDPDKHDFEYTGSGIASGSVISMQSNGTGGFTNFTINGISVASSVFSAKTGTSNFLSATDADQLYIVQGKFTAYGTAGTDRYNLLDGLPIHGITTLVGWIPLSTAVSAANTGGTTRQSRIPPELLCINTEFANSAFGFAHYNTSVGTSGSKATMLGRLRNLANWVYNTGTAAADDVVISDPVFNTTTYTINSPKADGDWNGTVSSDWFDCNNWEGLHVPDSSLLTTIFGGVPNNAIINITASSNAPEYSLTARAGVVTVLNNGVLSLQGPGSEKIIVEDSLQINAGGVFQFENSSQAATDSLQIYGSMYDFEPSAASGFIPGQGVVDLKTARFTSALNDIQKSNSFTFKFYKLAMNNNRGTRISGKASVANNLNLQDGLIYPSNGGGFTLIAPATITSPMNVYSQINKGYKNSFVHGLLFWQTDATTDSLDFPIGKIFGTDTLFAPVKLKKSQTNAITYNAEYFANAYSDLAVDIGQLSRVSRIEHWLINADLPNSDAKVTLSWRPQSLVGNGIPANDQEAMDSLRVAHYFDDDGVIGPNPPLWHVDGGDLAIMPKNGGANVNYGLITTNVNVGGFSPFTLGGKSPFNLLPARLLSFTAERINEEIKLIWKTREEIRVSYYEVEYSYDAIQFKVLGKTNPYHSLTEVLYDRIDSKPAKGWNYYRLKIVDQSGKASYSSIVKVWMGEALSLVLFPNPAQQYLNIQLPHAATGYYEAVVNNATGGKQLTFRGTDKNIRLDISRLSPGMYYLQVVANGHLYRERFIKQ